MTATVVEARMGAAEGAAGCYRPSALIVDDDPGWLAWLSFHLTHAGWEVTSAGSAEQAFGVLEEIGPDIVVVDRLMPGMSGVQFAETAREGGCGVPMLLLSALDDADIRLACERLRLHSLSKLAHAEIFRVLAQHHAELMGRRQVMVHIVQPEVRAAPRWGWSRLRAAVRL
jgi:CheY-like chemotaxis protein